jgi:uncharacterized lipoprotein YddW (UPF0748 family)
MDMARNYDVDGLHMDFVRYAGATWGYTPSSLAQYRSDTGATGTPAPDDGRWQAWRRDRVTAFVRDLHNDLKQKNPSVKLSAALICFGGGRRTSPTGAARRLTHQSFKTGPTGFSRATSTSGFR